MRSRRSCWCRATSAAHGSATFAMVVLANCTQLPPLLSCLPLRRSSLALLRRCACRSPAAVLLLQFLSRFPLAHGRHICHCTRPWPPAAAAVALAASARPGEQCMHTWLAASHPCPNCLSQHLHRSSARSRHRRGRSTATSTIQQSDDSRTERPMGLMDFTQVHPIHESKF
jgi:hypothetical protein